MLRWALTDVVVVIKAEDIALSLVEFEVPHIKGRFTNKSTSPRGLQYQERRYERYYLSQV